MNFLDVIFLVPVLWFVWQGFRRGLIIELATLAALILGIYAAIYFSGYAAKFIEENFTLSEDSAANVSYIITFILVFVIVFVLGKILEKVVDVIALGFLNKLAGAVFGVIKAVILISIFLAIINHYNGKLISEEKKSGSFFYGYIAPVALFIWQGLEDFDFNDYKFNKPADNKVKTEV